jgi:rRNA maturation endonuclease Nob1
MKCSKCGKTYDDKLNFCPFCGEKSHVVQDNIEMDNNYGGTLNRILNIICSKTVLSAICVVAGGLLALSFIKVSSFQSYLKTEEISEPFKVLKAASNSISSIPRYFAWSKYLSIYVFVVSLVNAIRKKEIDYTVLSSLSALNAFVLIINSKTVSILKQIMNLDLSSLYSSFYFFSSNESAYRLLKNPDRLVQGIQGEAGFGILFLIAAVLMFIFYLNQPHKYEKFNFKYLETIQKTVSNKYEDLKSEQAKLNSKASCAKCGRTLDVDMKFCPSCGEPVTIEEHKNHCKKCGKEFAKDMNFCPYCGQKAERVEKLVDTQAMREELLRRNGKKLCKKCDKAFNIEMNFCPFCGEKYEIQSENNTIRFAGDKFKESPFFKNYYVQLFTQVKLLSKIGIIVGALLSGTLVLVFGISNTMSTESISSTFESMKAFINVCKIVPVVYYISLIACCFVCIFAIVNLLKEIEIKVFILALVTGINSLLLLGSMNTIKLISGLYSLDLSDVMEGNISSSLVNSAGRFIQDPEQAMKDLTIAFGFGFILLGYCIYLHIQCKKNNSQ